MTRPARCEVGCRPICTNCGRVKAPRGRSVAAEAANGYCDMQCNYYLSDPSPCDLFPGETREDFGY